jgi:hypothetical protein
VSRGTAERQMTSSQACCEPKQAIAGGGEWSEGKPGGSNHLRHREGEVMGGGRKPGRRFTAVTNSAPKGEPPPGSGEQKILFWKTDVGSLTGLGWPWLALVSASVALVQESVLSTSANTLYQCWRLRKLSTMPVRWTVANAGVAGMGQLLSRRGAELDKAASCYFHATQLPRRVRRLPQDTCALGLPLKLTTRKFITLLELRNTQDIESPATQKNLKKTCHV